MVLLCDKEFIKQAIRRAFIDAVRKYLEKFLKIFGIRNDNKNSA